MAQERYVLKPLPNEDGERGYRLERLLILDEVDEFIRDNEMTNLFLLALAALQEDSLRATEDNKPDWLTFYSLAGIHGAPRENWNGIEQNPLEEDPERNYGYCHHGLDTFPVWHRPYMALFESAVYREMTKQAELFEDVEERAAFLKAAARFRLPYWDILMPRNVRKLGAPVRTIFGCPEILKKESVFVRSPKSKPEDPWFKEIANPLLSFQFPDEEERKQSPPREKYVEFPPQFDSTRTVRIPTLNDKGEYGQGDADLVIQSQAVQAAITLWQMLNPDEMIKPKIEPGKSGVEGPEVLINEMRSWKTFASHHHHIETIEKFNYSAVSLESFHDNIHVMIGTGTGKDKRAHRGHMGNPVYAAFDPIFWMHHNNIERLFCLFQALYPKKLKDANLTAKLKPFLKTEKECYYASDEFANDYRGSGYAVPGDYRLGDEMPDPDDLKDKVKQYLTDTYYWATTGIISTLKDWPKTELIKGSWALNGDKAIAVKGVAPARTALAYKNGKLEVVLEKVQLNDVESVAKEDVIPVAAALKTALTVDEEIPKSALDPSVTASVAVRSAQTTWNAHIKVRKFAFNGSFSIHLFIGHVKDDQAERYMTKKNEAGFTGVFASSDDSACATCKINREADIIVGDVIPLTTFLYDYLTETPGQFIRDGEKKSIENLTPEEVEPFLKEHLHWRMIDLGANLLEGQEQQAMLEITVTSRDFFPPTESNLMGAYGEPVEYPSITSGKPGGKGYVYA